MKRLFIYLVMLTIIISCGKVDDYCATPPENISIFEFGASGINVHKPSDKIKVYLNYDNSDGVADEKTLYSFSTPDCFINPKGDYTEDIVYTPEYTYILKDTANPPTSVIIKAYSFNDCGSTEVVSTIIKYN